MKTKPRLICALAAAGVFAGLCAIIPRIRAEDSPSKSGPALPFNVYDEKGDTNNHYQPSGWMGNSQAVRMDDGCVTSPHSGKTCFRCQYTAAGDWGGVAWQDPVNDWGDRPGGWNLAGHVKLTFWARGEAGGETVNFKFGILGSDKKYPDSSGDELDAVKLTTDWHEYTFNLAGKNLSDIKTGFVWTVEGQGHPVIFYLDDIRFE
jgi:hypothetical protein